MVATPEPFKALAKKIQKKNINEEDAKLLIAEYETEYSLDQVPAKALRGVIRTCRNKGAQLLGDPALEPAFVLKQWMGLEIDPPVDEEGGSEPEPEGDGVSEKEPSNEESGDSEPEERDPKPKKNPRKRNRKSGRKGSAAGRPAANLLSALQDGLGQGVDSGSASSESTYTRERKKRNRKAILLSSDSSSESDSSLSSLSTAPHDLEDRVSLKSVARNRRAMRLLCEKRESKNLYRGFVARAMNVSAYTATLTFGSIRNKREAETLARAVDFFVDQFGLAAVGKVDALEVLLRRYTAVLHAETSCWEFATCFEESPEGPFVEAKIFSRVKKMARLQGVPAQAMRLGVQGQGGRDDQGHRSQRGKPANRKGFTSRKLEGNRVTAPVRPAKGDQ